MNVGKLKEEEEQTKRRLKTELPQIIWHCMVKKESFFFPQSESYKMKLLIQKQGQRKTLIGKCWVRSRITQANI